MFNCFKKKKPKIKDLLIQTNSNDYPEHYLKTALSITGAFEGSTYEQVTGNFDGQGLSIGILQWNYGQGSLQEKILKPIIAEFGAERLDALFPTKISPTAYMAPKQAVKYAKKNMLIKTKVKDQWAHSWRVLLSSPEVKQIQLRAAHSVASRAWFYCNQYQARSIKAFCWFFDVVTQNGSLKNVTMPLDVSSYYDDLSADAGENKEYWDKYLINEEAKIFFVWICRRVTRNKWAKDVIARKGTIAHGHGKVHGKYYKLDDLFSQS